MDCPSIETFARWEQRLIHPTEEAAIWAHAEACPDCYELIKVACADAPQGMPAEVGPYQIVRLIGEGATGQVYDAFDARLDRHVAIKRLKVARKDSRAAERMEREARAAARIGHANVATLHGIEKIDEELYLIYELIDGSDLTNVEKPMPAPRLRTVALGLVRGLCGAHEAGILHRDIKPANALLTANDVVKLVDFGLAKLHPTEETQVLSPPLAADAMIGAGFESLTQTGAQLGTPRYMAPEIFRGERATTRSDVYSMGVVLYELASGALPYSATELLSASRDTQSREAPPLRRKFSAVDADFAKIVDRCLQHDPQRRFASGIELCAAMEAHYARGLKRLPRSWSIVLMLCVLFASTVIATRFFLDGKTEEIHPSPTISLPPKFEFPAVPPPPLEMPHVVNDSGVRQSSSPVSISAMKKTRRALLRSKSQPVTEMKPPAAAIETVPPAAAVAVPSASETPPAIEVKKKPDQTPSEVDTEVLR